MSPAQTNAPSTPSSSAQYNRNRPQTRPINLRHFNVELPMAQPYGEEADDGQQDQEHPKRESCSDKCRTNRTPYRKRPKHYLRTIAVYPVATHTCDWIP